MLHDFSVGQYDNLIRMLDRRKTVRYDQHRSDVLHLFHGILDQKLGFGVDVAVASSRITTEGLWMMVRANEKKLALSGGEVVSSLPHRLVEAVIQLVDKLVSIHVMADVHDLHRKSPPRGGIMLLRIVPENRKTSCSIWPNFFRRNRS